jgi:hypothetical protein
VQRKGAWLSRCIIASLVDRQRSARYIDMENSFHPSPLDERASCRSTPVTMTLETSVEAI